MERLTIKIVALVALAGAPAACWGQAAAPAPAQPAVRAGAETQRLNVESFEQVWQTVRDKYWDPKLGGIDWQRAHDEQRPQVEKAKTTAEAREVMRALLRRLGQSHFGIVASDAYREVADPAHKSGSGVPGFSVRVLDGRVLVVEVDEQQAASKMGVRPGWLVLKVANEDLGPALARVRKNYKDSTLLQLRLAGAVMGRLSGKVGDKVSVTFRNGLDQEVTLAIPLSEPQGARVTLGNLPPFHVRYESRRLSGDIAYVSLNAFFDPVRIMKAFEDTVRENLHARGFVLDLRGNPGGIGAMAAGFGGWFVSRPDQVLGTMTTRTGKLRFVINPRPETYDGPLAILVDGMTGSTSEIMSGGLQDLGRARIFGSRTAGAALPSVFVRLPNGDGFQYAFADYVSTSGKRLEGHGVQPDEVVVPGRQALLEGHDPVLEAAVAWINKQPRK